MGISAQVVVVGGGAAGIAAAAAAARVGADTVLIEREARPGGTATGAVLTTVAGLFEQAEAPRWLSEGLSRHLGGRLMALDGSCPEREGPCWVLPFSEGSYRRVLAELLEGVRVITGISVEQGEIEARAWVDATGDGSCAAHLGAAWEIEAPSELQRPAVSVLLDGVDLVALGTMARGRILLLSERAVSSGGLPESARGLQIRLEPPAGLLLKLNLDPPAGWTPTDPAARRLLLEEGLADLDGVRVLLGRALPPLARARVARRSTRLGVRESRRVVGRARLEASQVRGAHRDGQSVALGSWPIERWRQADRVELHPIAGPSYGIPLGALQSASSEALASARELGTCLETGQAAGTAAALAALGIAPTQPEVIARKEWA